MPTNPNPQGYLSTWVEKDILSQRLPHPHSTPRGPHFLPLCYTAYQADSNEFSKNNNNNTMTYSLSKILKLKPPWEPS